MKTQIKDFFRRITPHFLLAVWRKYTQKKLFEEWKKNGCPAPPPHLVKQLIIQEYQDKYKPAILVETGTYLGDMVEAQKRRFEKIYSIELGMDLFQKAKARFKNERHIKIIQGDSGTILTQVLAEINEPALFWLDGHYSAGITAKGDKECPIFEELDSILTGQKFNHILLIDDARCYNGEGDYPTIEQLTEYIKNKNENYQVEVSQDVIRCVV